MHELTALLSDPATWAAFATLVAMEVVLGIDNLIFISVLTNGLPDGERERARRLGIGAALGLRLLLLGSVAYIVQLTTPVLSALGRSFSWRDLLLIAGGLFLVWKATKEIHHKVDPNPNRDVFDTKHRARRNLAAAIAQIMLLDLVFSIDSIITAVGMADDVPVMVAAVLAAVSVMLLAATPLANLIARNPTVVMLALAFLLLIGTTLLAEGFGAHVPKRFVYAAMAFSAGVELLNIVARRARERQPGREGAPAGTGNGGTGPAAPGDEREVARPY